MATERPLPHSRQQHVREAVSAQELWAQIPVEKFRNLLRPLVTRMIREMIKEIQEGVPAFAQPVEGKFGKVLVTGIEQAVLQVVNSLGNPNPDTKAWEEWFRYAGRLEYREGRSMDSLQRAVRIGTRVAWRHVREAGRALNLSNDVLFGFADALFRYSDELSMVAIEGYTEAQATASGTVERRRQQLLTLLVSEQPSPPEKVSELAAAAHWTPPDRVCVIALEYRDDQHKLPASRLGDDVLLDLESTEPCLLMADPDTHLDALAKELDGRRAAIGPRVPLADAHRSLATARRALSLLRRGVLPDADIVDCAEHLTTLALCADEFLLAELTERALTPFASLTPKQRERHSQTLLAWLGTRGGVNEVAERLGVHPQTVRYRMNQINELLGERLADPDERLRLEIALRAAPLVERGKGAG
jgi:hypothetical protein